MTAQRSIFITNADGEVERVTAVIAARLHLAQEHRSRGRIRCRSLHPLSDVVLERVTLFWPLGLRLACRRGLTTGDHHAKIRTTTCR